MTLLQSGQAATDSDFHLRVQAATFKLAQDVLNEPDTTPGYIVRRSLAEAVVREPAVMVGRFVWLCASNPAIASTVTGDGTTVLVDCPDGDIEFVVASNWNVVAGWQGTANNQLLRG